MPVTYDVPEDIIISIIAELDTDRKTLRACASVARSFWKPAQQQLFSEIVLDLTSYPADMNRIQQLHTSFIQNPQLRTYVHSLKLRFGTEDIRAVPTGKFYPLPQLRKLDMNFRPLGGFMIRWRRLSPALQTDFYDLLQSPHLEQLTILGLDGFPIGRLPHNGLQLLTMTDCCLFKDTRLLIPVDSIRILRVHCRLLQTDSIETCQYLLDLLPTSLEHFRLLVNNAYNPHGLDKLDLSALRHLRSLHLAFTRTLHFALQHLKKFFEQSLPSTLEQITIERTFMSFSRTLADGDVVDLNGMDEILAGVESLSARVHISLAIPPGLDSDIVQQILPLIPRLVERGGISIDAGNRRLWTHHPQRQDLR